MKTITCIILIFTFSINSVIAQTEATTTDGKKVVLNDDGTWKYQEPKEEVQVKSMECKDLIVTETDKVTGKSSTSSKETIVISEDGGKTGFGIFTMLYSESIILSIQAVGAGNCIDEGNKMNILFRDGTRLEMLNAAGFNCEGKFTVYLGGSFGNKKELELLKSKEIETMRVWTSQSYVERDFSIEEGMQLKNTINCLWNSK